MSSGKIKRNIFLVISLSVILTLFLGFIVIKYGKKDISTGSKNPGSMENDKKPVAVSDANDLLAPLPPDATEKQKFDKYHDFQRAAREAPYLEIKDCKPDPIVIKVLDKSYLVIKNSGDQTRTLYLESNKYVIPAHGQTKISLDFAFKQKMTANGTVQTRWWYGCDLKSNVTAGIIWVGIGYDR